MHYSKERAQESRAAVERLYIAMRHLFIRGSYKPLGMSGEAMIEALMVLRPEIYGTLFFRCFAHTEVHSDVRSATLQKGNRAMCPQCTGCQLLRGTKIPQQ